MIVYIDPSSVPGTSPEALQLLQTANAMAEEGRAITLVTAPPEAGCSAESILGRPLSPRLTLVSQPALWRMLPIQRRSSRLFTLWAGNWLRTQPAVSVVYLRNLKLADALAGKTGKIPVVFESHEIFAHTFRDEHPHPTLREERKLAQLQAREARVYGKVSGLVGLTALLVDDIREAYGYRGPAGVAPDGVDLDFIQSCNPGGVAPKSAPVRLLYLGSLHVWKGVETALAALPDIPGAILQIAGGPAKRVEELRFKAGQLGVADRVELLGSVAPVKRFATIAGADICLLPLGNYTIAQRHTSPLKLFEYLAMGKPVVATDCPALREVVSDGVNAALFPVDQAGKLADAVNRLIGNPEERLRMGEAGRQLAQSYSWRCRARRILDFCGEHIEP